MTIANLGIAVDSSQAASAGQVLDQLAAISRNTAATVAALEANAKAMATALANVSRGAAPATQSIKSLQQAIQAYANDLTKATGAVNDMTAVGQTKLDQLRAKYSPLFAAQQQYRQQLGDLKDAQRAGALTQEEYSNALTDTKVAFIQQVNALRPGRDALAATGDAAKKAADAHGGLTTQAMAAQHAMRSMVEQLAMGIPVTQVLTGQMNHLTYAASGEGGLTGAFKGAIAPLRGMLTASTLTFGGIAAAIGVATIALNSYLNAQNKVQASLLGAGRASGATSGTINAAASAGSSATGFSVSEARDLASALAATGKVASDNILPIVKMGHDISIAFGTDAKGATELLAQAFSDPVKGADQLNQRLGFLDAATKQNITNLVAQNNLYGAQQVLLKGVQSGLQGFADTQDAVTKGWAAIGNAASNAWTAVGKFFANAAGLGQSLEDRLAAATQRLNALKAAGGTSLNMETGLGISGGDAAIAAQQAEVDKLTAAVQRNADASITAAAAQKSFLQQSTVRDLTPEIAQQEALNNQLRVLQGLFDQLSHSETAGETLKQLGTTFAQLTNAMTLAADKAKNFKNEFQQAISANTTAMAAITAFSPSAKANIAFQQSMDSTQNSNYTTAQRQVLAQQQYAIAIKQATTALSEQARAQLLSANQAVASAKLDVDLVGKSIEQQTLYRANLQARQQLEQTASQNRTKFDQSQYDALVKINEQQAKNVQLAAQTAAQDNANFALQTAFLSDIDAQIASVQRQLHGNAWPQYMNDGLAATMRIADGLKQIHDLGQDVTRGVFTDFETQIRNGASAMDALRTAGVNALGKIADKLAQMAADNLWKSAFGGVTGGGGLLSLLGIGGSAGATSAVGSATTLGSLYHSGGIVGSEPTSMRYVHPACFASAPRFHTGLMPDEFPAILQKGEGVFTKGQMAAMGAANSNTPQSMNINVNVSGARGSQEITDAVNAGVGQALSTYRKSPAFVQDVGNANIKAGKLRVGR